MVSDDSRLKALEHLFSNGDVWANAMLHHSPWGLGAAVSPLATVEQPRFVTAPSWLHSWAALLFSYVSTALTISAFTNARKHYLCSFGGGAPPWCIPHSSSGAQSW